MTVNYAHTVTAEQVIRLSWLKLIPHFLALLAIGSFVFIIKSSVMLLIVYCIVVLFWVVLRFCHAGSIAKQAPAEMVPFDNTAITQERIRIARDLHDNLLQFLPGIAMYLEAISQSLPSNSEQTKAQLQEVQELITSKQHELRDFVSQIKNGDNALAETDLECRTYLECLGQTLSHQWGIKVSLSAEPLIVRMPLQQAREIRYLLHEAMMNSARHSKGNRVHAVIHRKGNKLQILVHDNGCGFPFKGRYGLDELNAKNIGPKILKERIAVLGGWLVIDSSAYGSNLWISLPIPQPLNQREA